MGTVCGVGYRVLPRYRGVSDMEKCALSDFTASDFDKESRILASLNSSQPLDLRSLAILWHCWGLRIAGHSVNLIQSRHLGWYACICNRLKDVTGCQATPTEITNVVVPRIGPVNCLMGKNTPLRNVIAGFQLRHSWWRRIFCLFLGEHSHVAFCLSLLMTK